MLHLAGHTGGATKIEADYMRKRSPSDVSLGLFFGSVLS
jgi:hypothetical protein